MEEYAKPRTRRERLSYWKIGLTTMAATQQLLSGMPLVLKIELIRLWSCILPEPGQPSAQLSKLIRLTACKKAVHATSRWYRTVYIPWLVAFYDTHKGKRWLNSNPPNHRGKTLKTYSLQLGPRVLMYNLLEIKIDFVYILQTNNIVLYCIDKLWQ